MQYKYSLTLKVKQPQKKIVKNKTVFIVSQGVILRYTMDKT